MSFIYTIAKRALRFMYIALPTRIGNTKLRVPLIGGVGIDNRYDAEPWMTNLMSRLLALVPHTGFFDVGVNLGQTLLKFRSLNAVIPYVGFEPNPLCVLYANEAIRVNGFQQCAIMPVGLSDKPAVCEFFAANDDDSSASIVEGLRPGQYISKKQFVPVFPLDDLAGMLPRASLVKIDVEGAELQVLLGMEAFLDSNHPWIICEVLYAHSQEVLQAQHQRNERLMQFVTAKGYHVFQIVKNGEQVRLTPVDAFSEGIYRPESQDLCDYLFVPAAQAGAAQQAFA